MKKKNLTCYACSDTASTTEHVPPKSFFPKDRRSDLITLPSCVKHNNENSSDVEYVRNVLSVHVDTDLSVADSVYKAAWRSYDRRPAILKKLFADVKPAFFEGQETGVFTVEMDRVNRVMSAIATGIYRHAYERPFLGSWTILCPTSFGMDEIESGIPSSFQQMREALAGLTMELLPTRHTEIFSCRVRAESLHELIFEFQFYSGPKFYAVSIPFWRNQPRKMEI